MTQDSSTPFVGKGTVAFILPNGYHRATVQFRTQGDTAHVTMADLHCMIDRFIEREMPGTVQAVSFSCRQAFILTR